MKNKKLFFSIIISVIAICAVLLIGAFALANNSTETPSLSIVGKNLSFSESIYIKYAVSCENVDDTTSIKLLVWDDPQNEYTVGTEDFILTPQEFSTVNGKNCAIFNFKELAAKQMTDTVYARAFVEVDGVIYYSEAEKYSILNYVYNKLGYTGTKTENEDLCSLLQGMLEYGASAQEYFNYKTDTLATDKHVKITLEDGVFADGFNTAFAIPGAKLTITAKSNGDLGRFLYWEDENKTIISKDQAMEITVGSSNMTLHAVFASFVGGDIPGAGSTLSDDSFALTEHNIDTGNFINKTSAQLQSMLSTGLVNGAVYRVSDGETLRISHNVNGNGAAIIAPAGVIIENVNSISVSNLIILGNVSIANSDNITLTSVEINSDTSALNIDDNCTNVTIDNCRVIAQETAVFTSARNTSIKNSYISSDDCVIGCANELSVYNSKLIASVTGVTSNGVDCSFMNNDLTVSSTGSGIVLSDNSLNSLVAYNNIAGSEYSVKIGGATNTVILFNSVFNIASDYSTNTYIVENSIGGRLELSDNDYLLCDSNSYHSGADHTVVSTNNSNVNGDSLMDVTARNEVGAKEELLPHTNKDLFIDMERKTTVKDIANGTSYDLNTYIEENAKTNGVVIVPPGAYTTVKGDFMHLKEAASNTVIYAFGVYNEHEFVTNEEYLATQKTNYIIQIEGAKNLTIHGMTNAYNYQSLGQANVLAKLGNNQILVVPSAGFDLEAGWGLSNPGVFRANFYACHKGEPTPWFETSYTYVRTNADKTIVIQVTEANYNKLEVGDLLCTRMAGDNQRSISVVNAENILFKDCVLHGYAAALAHVITGRSYNVKLERVHNCPTSPYVMSKEDYEYFTALEAQYPGVDFEMYVDSEGRYRGTQPRFCSVDATHVISRQGLDIESCLFEQMCDDGSNQHGSSARLYGITDNGDGTATVYVKGNVTSVYHGIYTSSDNHNRTMDPLYFDKGDNIFIYTPDGEIVCDGICLTHSNPESQLNELYYLGDITYKIVVNSVKVPIESVNFAALEGYDLKDNHYRMDNKITVDNINTVSGNFTIDNYLIRNSWSRGVLTKTVNATIKNSTFQHIKSTGILGNCEPEWGESTIPRYISVENCVFDDTGFAGETWDDPKIAPVYISGLSTYGEANIHKIISTNFIIKGCHFLNYGHQYGICIDGAQNIKIIDNIFDPKTSSAPGNFIKITTAVNVEISGNKYRNEAGTLTTISGIDANDYADIHGTDVEGLFPHEFDVYVAGTHLSNFKIVPEDKANLMAGNILASKLKPICGYSVASTVMPYEKEIRLAVNDSESNLIKSNTYAVACVNGQLVITAETNSALIYAVEHFAAQLSSLKSQGQKSISFAEGYTKTYSFTVKEYAATNSSAFKYTGIWNTSGSAMVSGGDADYVEFNFTGYTFTLLFNGETTFKVSIDEKAPVTYTVSDEITFTLAEGAHTVRLSCADKTKPITFSGIKTSSTSTITKLANKDKYIQFIGDSMVDYDTSFAHRVGDVLGWDFSVVVGNTLPSTSVSRVPDIYVIFLGTDAITASSTQTEINNFVNTYSALATSIKNRNANATIYVLQSLTNSANASDILKRNSAISSAVTAIRNNGISVSVINPCAWDVEFDTAVSTKYPTINGDYTVTVNLAKYLLQDAGSSDYINVNLPLTGMNGYPTDTMANATIEENLTENGISFRRFNFVQYGHAWLTGNDSATAVADVAGRYLVLMYRASGEADIKLEIRTNDYGYNLPESGKGYLSGVYKTENNVPEDWEIAIVDLAQFAHYTVGLTNTKIQLRISTESDTLDIAFAAIVDDLNEAEMAAMFELGATQYKFYEDWSKVGVDVSLNGLEPEKPFDDSFVNQEYGILGMTGYNSTPVLHVKTDEGVDFVRYNFSVQGHVFLTGQNNFIGVSGDTGRYLVLKYRATNNAYISLNALTSDFEYDESGKTMATKTKSVENINPGVWEVAVIDLSVHTNSTYGTQYTTDTDLDVWIRLTTAAEEIDISYCAIVDDLDEAAAFIDYKGDTSYVHYTDWSKTGITVTID